MIYLILFLEFFKIGLLSIGGGLASLPFLQELVEKYGWITHDELLNMIAISESTPGPIGTNVATYVGFTVGGVPGALIATFAEVAPAVITITLLSRYLRSLSKNPIVQGGFAALRPAVAGLIGAVAFQMARSEFLPAVVSELTGLVQTLDWGAIGLGALLLFVLQKYDWHPILVLAGSAVVGILFQM